MLTPTLRTALWTWLRRLLAGGLVILTAMVMWVLWNWDFIFHRIGTVDEGVLYRSAELSPAKLDAPMREYGIRTVVNLHSEMPAGEQPIAEQHGARYLWLPSAQVPAEANIETFLEVMDNPANHPVLVHCKHGVGRTGVVSGVYRMEYEGWDSQHVLDEARWYAFWGSYWDGQDKTSYLEGYVPRAERTDSAPPGE